MRDSEAILRGQLGVNLWNRRVEKEKKKRKRRRLSRKSRVFLVSSQLI